jgi:DNA-binding transcriptional regulator YiaG
MGARTPARSVVFHCRSARFRGRRVVVVLPKNYLGPVNFSGHVLLEDFPTELLQGDPARAGNAGENAVRLRPDGRTEILEGFCHRSGRGAQIGHELGTVAVQARIEEQAAVGAHVELCGPRARNLLGPFADGGPANAEHASDFYLRAAEELNHVTLTHGGGRYRIGNRQVNDGKPVSAGELLSMEEREETMGERIRRLREAKNLTQPALARLLTSMGASSALGKAAIHKWESGDTKNMQNATFILLCQALATDAPYLLWGPDRAPPEVRPAPITRVIKRRT